MYILVLHVPLAKKETNPHDATNELWNDVKQLYCDNKDDLLWICST
jgi:hypothetical protein